jgi:hypothetical protein
MEMKEGNKTSWSSFLVGSRRFTECPLEFQFGKSRKEKPSQTSFLLVRRRRFVESQLESQL